MYGPLNNTFLHNLYTFIFQQFEKQICFKKKRKTRIIMQKSKTLHFVNVAFLDKVFLI